MEPEGCNMTASCPRSRDPIAAYRQEEFIFAEIAELQEYPDSSVEEGKYEHDIVHLPDSSSKKTYANKFVQTEHVFIDAVVLSESCNDASSTSESDRTLFHRLYRYSLVLGFLVGCFIQTGSLGSSYVLTAVLGRDFSDVAKHYKFVVVLTLIWSTMAGVLGFTILFVFRSLLMLAATGIDEINRASGRPPVVLEHLSLYLATFLELPFSFGSFIGLCCAWTVTNVVVGQNTFQFLLNLAFLFSGIMALPYARSVAFETSCGKTPVLNRNLADEVKELEVEKFSTNELLLSDGDVDQWSVQQSLLPKTKHSESDNKITRVQNDFKTKSMVAGLLLGFLVQASCLGATFLFAMISRNTINSASSALPTIPCSCMFGVMGVAIHLHLRYFMSVFCGYILSKNQSPHCNIMLEENTVRQWIESMDFFFPFGCLTSMSAGLVITLVGMSVFHLADKIHFLGSLGCILTNLFALWRIQAQQNGHDSKMVTIATQTS